MARGSPKGEKGTGSLISHFCEQTLALLFPTDEPSKTRPLDARRWLLGGCRFTIDPCSCPTLVFGMQPDAQKRRSRSGCTECRQRHRKCDEKKPACTGCERAGKQCTYTMRLSWGGRPFSKSRFGECMKSDPSLVQLPVVSSSGKSSAHKVDTYGVYALFSLIRSLRRIPIPCSCLLLFRPILHVNEAKIHLSFSGA